MGQDFRAIKPYSENVLNFKSSYSPTYLKNTNCMVVMSMKFFNLIYGIYGPWVRSEAVGGGQYGHMVTMY